MNILTTVNALFKPVRQFAVKNASHLLMGFATVDSILALIFAAKAVPKARQAIATAVLDKTEREGGDEVSELTIPEKIQAAGKYYIPAAGFELLALTCFWGAHWIDIRRQAVLVGLAATAEEALREYQRQVKETMGEETDRMVQENQAKEFVEKNPPPTATYILDNDTDRWYVYKGQYFRSSYVKIKDSQNMANHEMIQHMYITESELMWLLDPSREYLKPDDDSGMVGWNVDRMMQLNIYWGDDPRTHTPVGVVKVEDMDGFRYDPEPGFSKGL